MNKIGTLDIIKAYLGNKELSANNAYIGEIPLIKGAEPLYKDYFYLQPSQAVTYNVGTDGGVVSTSKRNTFEYSFDQIHWTAINDIPHTGSSMSIGDIMTEHPTYAVLALTRSAYNQYVIGNGYEIWCYHWDDGKPNSWPGTQANFIGADSTYAFYYLDLGVAQVNIIWNIVIDGMALSQTSDMMQMSAGQLVVWNGENRSGSTDNSSNYYLENLTWDDVQIDANQKMYLRNTAGLGISSVTNSATKIINAIQNVSYNVGGNIETIYNYTSDNNMTSYFALYLFKGDTHIINAGDLILPATSLAYSCYSYMFYGCTSLTTAPALPATTLADYCYHYMFGRCNSLTQAPALPATSLASSCYNSMFNHCTSLTKAPALPATSLATNCYYYMFGGCTSLADVKVNSDTIVYFTGWLNNVSPSGTITINRNAWYTTSSSSVPSGWTIIETGDLYEYELILTDQILNSDQIIFVTEYNGTYRTATIDNYASSISGNEYGLILSKETINVSNNKFSSSELRKVQTESIDLSTAYPLWLRVYEVSSGIYAFVNKEWVSESSNYLQTYTSTKAGSTRMNGSNLIITLPEYNYSIGSGTAPLISNITGSGSYKNLYATITTSGGYITNNSSGNSFMIFRRVSNDRVPNDEIWYTSSDGNIVTPHSTSALPTIVSNTYVDGKGIIKYASDITSIGKDAFYNCSGFTSITIPNSVTSIGTWAFSSCRSLTSMMIPNSVTSIGDSAFHSCSGLTSVTIGNSVTSIGEYAFRDCAGLTSVTIGNSVTSIEYAAFDACKGLSSITYAGTIAQWNAITKGSYWNQNVPATVVHCTDGDAPI